MESTERFTNRVDDYVKYRPTYPRALLDLLRSEVGLKPEHEIADLGSGTGLSAHLFLEAGHRVYGVEPNAAMRSAGEKFLAAFPRFTSVAGTAEATSLPAACVDFALAGQAFHWFDPARARVELARILRPKRAEDPACSRDVILVWNAWHQEQGPFIEAYRELVHRFTLEKSVEERHSEEKLLASVTAFFGEGGFVTQTLENRQVFDFDGLLGRARSASYVPPVGHPSYEPMAIALRELFDRFAAGGRIQFPMKTRVFIGGVFSQSCADPSG